MRNLNALCIRAQALGLRGLLAHWSEVAQAPWLPALLQWEEVERARRSLERRLKDDHIGRFKALCDFDWSWPKRADPQALEAPISLGFLTDATNVVLQGPNGSSVSTTFGRSRATAPPRGRAADGQTNSASAPS